MPETASVLSSLVEVDQMAGGQVLRTNYAVELPDLSIFLQKERCRSVVGVE